VGKSSLIKIMSGESNYSEKYTEEESILNPVIIRNTLNPR